MNIYLKLKEESNIVVDSYIADSKQDDSDILYQIIDKTEDGFVKAVDDEGIQSIGDFLGVKDADGNYCLKYDGSLIVMLNDEKTIANEKMQLNYQMVQELREIENWYRETDYIVLKVMRGNWNAADQRYSEYLEEYEKKHARAEQIKLELGG